MREWLACTLTMTILPSCGGVAELPSNKEASASAAAIDSGQEKDVTVMDDAVAPGPVDSSTEAMGLEDSPAEATVRCGTACPTSEPTVGDSCEFALSCEYGGSPFVWCNRVYECISGYVALEPWPVPDASACPESLSPGCPASRTVIGPGAPCGASSLQCAYTDAECDCIQGHPTATWVCSDVDAGGTGSCPVPRAMLGTPCSPTSPPGCQFVAPRLYEACSPCGNQWAIDNVP
jgi:hypothetical protein